MAQRRRRHGAVQLEIVDAIELELEKQEVAGQRSDALLCVAVKLCDRWIAGVGGVEQRRVGHDAADQILQRLIRFDRYGQRFASIRLARKMRDLAAIRLRE